MRGLTAEETNLLRDCLPGSDPNLELSDNSCALADQLVNRGLMRTWKNIDPNDGYEWEWFETNSTGIMLLRIINSLSIGI